MLPVDQTQFKDVPYRGVRGNCLSACVASILEVDLDTVPHWAEMPQEIWADHFLWWMRERGLEVETYYHPEYPAGYVIAAGESPRSGRHAVVAVDGVVVHDPHPSREGLAKVSHYWQLNKIGE